ncbi:hypothetical protein [Amycolatopsis sp.]|uniref:hypothetical protein n=1 Tax=Amycolatopsis sp. TaxID=37632 RepID=UPI002C1AF601|nr:hypothetical protein [Amycolatopsis sp.]HVV14718.1 hypothetical protein [Amycolatopsis sp.]
MTRDAKSRARIAEHWRASELGDTGTEQAIYAVGAVLDYPRCGERFRGRAKIQAQRGGHPGGAGRADPGVEGSSHSQDGQGPPGRGRSS